MGRPQSRDIDVAVVLRCAGERTAELSRELLAGEVGPARVAAIHEMPFSRAVRRTFEIGLDAGRRWTLAVDADVLIRSGAVRELVGIGERSPDNVFKLNGRIVDKLFGGPRHGGLHLYRTALLGRAIPFTDPAEPVHRPERHVLTGMERLGFGLELHNVILGLHDFEQWHRDLYRKGFVHAQKHAECLEFLVPMWRRLAGGDPDFHAVLLGADAGRRSGGVARTDIRAFGGEPSQALGSEGMAEKPALDPTDWTGESVGRLIRGASTAPEYAKWLPGRGGAGPERRLRTLLAAASASVRDVVRRLFVTGRAGREF